MDDQQINDIAESLESAAPFECTKAKLARDMPLSCVGISANRAGFLRLAAACLRAATTPIRDDDRRSALVDIDDFVEELSTEESGRGNILLQRVEASPEPPELIRERERQQWRRDRFGLVGCGLIAFTFLFLLVMGIIATFQMFLAA